MKTKLAQLAETFSNLPLMIWGMVLMLFIQILVSWIFVRFVHYDAQNRVLPPSSYRISIISDEDFARLGDKTLDTVELSDGTKFSDRQQSFYDSTLPNYKPLDGGQHVLVTTIGTRHFYRYWCGEMFPFMFFIAVTLVLATRNLRNQQPSK